MDSPDVYGTRGLVCNRHGSRYGVQDDGQERTAGYHEVVQAIGDFNYPMLVVSSGRHGYGKQREQLVRVGFPILYPELYRLLHS